MNKSLHLILCLAIPLLVNGQSFNREQIVGTWVAKEVLFTEGQTGMEIVEKTKRALINSKFIFRHNGLFHLQLPGNAPAEFHELESLNNKMWHIKSKERTVFVGSLDEDLMSIHVQNTKGACYFLIRDSPLMLRMERSR